MRLAIGLSAVLVALVSTGAAHASSCSEQIATIERRLDSAGAARVTGKEPAGGTTTSASPRALEQPPGGTPSDPATTASVSGIREARDLIAKARGQDKAGDVKGCEETMTKAKEKAGALP